MFKSRGSMPERRSAGAAAAGPVGSAGSCIPQAARASIVGVALATLFGTSALSEGPRRLALVGPFKEAFLANSKVSGALLLGLAYGPPSDRFDPSSIMVSLPPLASGAKACVSAVSRDGRYSSENLYDVPAGAAGWGSIPFDTRFRTQLEQYGAGELAVLASIKGSCDDPGEGTLVPVTVSARKAPTPGDRTLVLMLNADPARVAVDLSDGPREEHASCSEPEDGSRIAFGAICQVDLPERSFSGPATLRVSLQERFSTASTSFAVVLQP